jgi:hypothetical protein
MCDTVMCLYDCMNGPALCDLFKKFIRTPTMCFCLWGQSGKQLFCVAVFLYLFNNFYHFNLLLVLILLWFVGP